MGVVVVFRGFFFLGKGCLFFYWIGGQRENKRESESERKQNKTRIDISFYVYTTTATTKEVGGNLKETGKQPDWRV